MNIIDNQILILPSFDSPKNKLTLSFFFLQQTTRYMLYLPLVYTHVDNFFPLRYDL